MQPPESKDSHRTHKQRPLAGKESRRWLDLMDAATADVPPTTRVIMVADREGDVFDVFGHVTETGRDVLVRAAWDRRLVEPAGALWATGACPRDRACRGAPTCRRPSAHGGRDAAASPRHLAPAAPGMEWMLLPTLSVGDRAAAETVVRYYTDSWRVERDHDVLKSGGHIEDLPLETFDRLDRALAVYRIIAWRRLWLTYRAREQPASPARRSCGRPSGSRYMLPP